MNIAISYGSYYDYLKPKDKFLAKFNIEAKVKVHNDGEIEVDFPDSIRGKRMFIFGDGVKNLSELLMTIDAAKRSSAAEINVVFPYYPACRQDKKGKDRGNIGTAVIARVLESLGVNRIIAIDLHSEQIQGCFNGPLEHISGRHMFVPYIQEEIIKKNKDFGIRLCSPDVGGGKRVEKFCKELYLRQVLIDKVREEAGVVKDMYLLGEVKDQVVVLIDDIADTCNTLIKGVKLLYENGAKEVICVITHPVLSNNALKRLEEENIQVVFANTRNTIINAPKNVTSVNCSDILHQAILNIGDNKSIHDLR